MISEQELFDQTAIHLLSMGGPSMDDSGQWCRYRGPGGRRCSVGFWITDDEYSPDMDMVGSPLSGIQHLFPPDHVMHCHATLLRALQRAHDLVAITQSPSDDTTGMSESEWLTHIRARLLLVSVDQGLSAAVLG